MLVTSRKTITTPVRTDRDGHVDTTFCDHASFCSKPSVLQTQPSIQVQPHADVLHARDPKLRFTVDVVGDERPNSFARAFEALKSLFVRVHCAVFLLFRITTVEKPLAETLGRLSGQDQGVGCQRRQQG